VVMSFDNRGTKSPRGRDWRKCVYRKIGSLGPRDQAAAVKAVLQSRPWLDPQRVGVWGWSGGGSSSLHAIFKYPDLYQTAIAVAPVPNQRYYDTIYQERYMGLPDVNAEDYRLGSPITYADQLKGNLLLGLETSDSRMSRIAKNELYFGSDIAPEEVAARIDATTNEQIVGLAERLLRPEAMAITLLGDLKGKTVGDELLNAG